jgi:hypothetical protein
VGRHYGRNESEETWREYLYSFQAFKRPAFRQTAQQLFAAILNRVERLRLACASG